MLCGDYFGGYTYQLTDSRSSVANHVERRGATFPYPMYARWFAEYHRLHQDIEIEYEPIGSGRGIREITAGVLDFGASDGPMDDSQLKECRAKRGMEILHFPTVLGAYVPTYNIPGLNVSKPDVAVRRRVDEINPGVLPAKALERTAGRWKQLPKR